MTTTENHSTNFRQKKIVEILTLLHEGGSFDEAKEIFDASFSGVDVSEITSAERELISSGLNPSEIQHLCNVHAAVFKGSIQDIHHSNLEYEQPGHPVHTLKLENRVLGSLLNDELLPTVKKWAAGQSGLLPRIQNALQDLLKINLHYTRKENLMFPFMEQYGITAPPKVMWGVDDQIRDLVKKANRLAQTAEASPKELLPAVEEAAHEIEEMIFKEEEILVPMDLEAFSSADWAKIAAESPKIGFAWISEPLPWKPAKTADDTDQTELTTFDWEKTDGLATGKIVLPNGVLALGELKKIFDILPVDLSFVDKNDLVQFFSEGERIFPRSRTVIGREVINCHPPKSLAMVQQILDDFRSGKKDVEDFWLTVHGRKIYIRYFAVRDDDHNYLGCLEVAQDITKISQLTGQKTLLSEASVDDKTAD